MARWLLKDIYRTTPRTMLRPGGLWAARRIAQRTNCIKVKSFVTVPVPSTFDGVRTGLTVLGRVSWLIVLRTVTEAQISSTRTEGRRIRGGAFGCQTKRCRHTIKKEPLELE
jgi:hypothetical protein